MRDRERKRAERERKAERIGEAERGAEGWRGCVQSSLGFSPESHSSDAQVLRK